MVILVLSLLGLVETGYLISCRLRKQRPVCFAGTHCSLVLESDYNNLFGIHNDILGFLFYVACGMLSLLLMMTVGSTELELFLLRIVVGFGAVMSVFLIFLQWKVIKAWCFWCLVSALTTWVMAAVVFVR